MNKQIRIGLLCMLVAVSALTIGCSSGDADRGTITGNVTYQGEPVNDGQIVFSLADNSATEGAQIVDGQFESKAPIGDCIVRITGQRVVKGEVDTSNPGEEGVVYETYIPVQYNDNSDLKFTVTSGSQEKDFTLE